MQAWRKKVKEAVSNIAQALNIEVHHLKDSLVYANPYTKRSYILQLILLRSQLTLIISTLM